MHRDFQHRQFRKRPELRFKRVPIHFFSKYVRGSTPRGHESSKRYFHSSFFQNLRVPNLGVLDLFYRNKNIYLRCILENNGISLGGNDVTNRYYWVIGFRARKFKPFAFAFKTQNCLRFQNSRFPTPGSKNELSSGRIVRSEPGPVSNSR